MDVRLFLRAQWDRVAGWGLVGLGALALLLGWLGVSDTALTHEQIPYIISGGLLGIALVGIGATLLLTAELRDEWRKLDSLEDAVREAVDSGLLPTAEPEPQAPPARARRRAGETAAARNVRTVAVEADA